MPTPARDALRRNAGHLASVALVIMWSSGYVGAELGTRTGGTPLQLLGWRFSILGVLLLSVCLVLGVRLADRRAWARQAVLGLFSQAVFLFMIFEGVARGVDGGTAALIAALQPLLVATVAGRFLGERTTPVMWFGMLLGMAGVVVVVSGGLGAGSAPWWAYLFPVAGMLSLATGTVLTQRLRPTETLLQAITMQSVVAAGALVAAMLLVGQGAVPADPDFWVAVAWLVFLSTLCGYVLYVFVTRTRGATVASVLLYLTPPTTMVWVWLMFGVPITLLAVVGMAVSAVGVVLVLRSRAGAQAHLARR
ncbi:MULTISPECIES: DMT family transporter [unclassified Dietzia]|uniref:DMT family transporter n=1 Tax=unclassified Dietzia TaxID=2617939 RepID=UPI0015FB727C|nr:MULTISPECIES: DMT family transporter [unclassified Dietzia]MBB1024669.1 DMT family transporter [Dietzia sp. DQ12-76]MBB1028963.1 DMT family transporter [Dietzia sp. DQ11-38-2]